MEKERKGCFIMIAVIFLSSAGIYIASELDWPYLKHLSTMLCCMTAGHVESTYYRPASAKPISKKRWIWYYLAIFVLAGIFTWIECNRK